MNNFLFMLFFLIIFSCNNQKTAEIITKPANLNNSVSNKNLIFYYSQNNEIKVVTDYLKIPDEFKSSVMIVDKTLSPEQRMSNKYVYVGDLTKIENDKIPYKILTRKEYENLTKPKIVVYTTKTCPVCKQLTEYLDSKKIEYTNVDVEENYEGQKELIIKAKQSDMSIQGVPVIDLNGKLIMGFDKDLIEQYLSKGMF